MTYQITKADLYAEISTLGSNLTLSAGTFRDFADDIDADRTEDFDGEPLLGAILHQLDHLTNAAFEATATVRDYQAQQSATDQSTD